MLRLYRDAFSGLPREVWLLSIAAVINRAGSMVLPFLSLYLTTQLGYPTIEASWVLFAFGLGGVAGSYLGGWLSDRIGAIAVQELSLFGAAVGFLVLSQVESLPAFVLVVLIVSTVSDAFRPAALAAITDISPAPVRTRGLALLRMAVNLGMAAGPTIGGLLATIDYFWLFVADGLTCGLAALMIFVTLHRARPPQQPIANGGADGATARPWRDGPLLAMLALTFLVALAFFQVFCTLPLLLRHDYGFPEDRIGLLIGFNCFLIVLLEMVLIRAVERFDRLLVIGIGFLLICVGLALMPLGTTLLFAAFTVVIWTVGEMLSLPLTNAFVADRATSNGPGSSGAYMGLYTVTFGLASLVAPVGGMWIYGRYGGDILFYSIGALAIPLLLGCLVLSRVCRNQIEGPPHHP